MLDDEFENNNILNNIQTNDKIKENDELLTKLNNTNINTKNDSNNKSSDENNSIKSLHDKINNSSMISFFKEKFNTDNSCFKYIDSIIGKHKYIILFVVLIILITFIEITIATNISSCAYTLIKDKIIKIRPDCVPLDKNEYIYVYNVNTFKRNEVIEKAKIPESYKKQTVTEHLTKQILKPINNMKNGFSNILRTSTPINDISNNILNSVKIKDVVNPLNSYNSLDSSWSVFYPGNIKLSCFIANGKIYFN